MEEFSFIGGQINDILRLNFDSKKELEIRVIWYREPIENCIEFDMEIVTIKRSGKVDMKLSVYFKDTDELWDTLQRITDYFLADKDKLFIKHGEWEDERIHEADLTSEEWEEIKQLLQRFIPIIRGYILYIQQNY